MKHWFSGNLYPLSIQIPTKRSGPHNGLYKKIDIDNEPDQKYKTIMINQYRWMEKNKESIINKAKNLHSKYTENKLPDNIKNRCANYPRLEKLLDRYMIERQSKVNAKENTR